MGAEYLALLRGVNVGGHGKLPMKALQETVAALGCTNVKTFIQSGNVVFNAPEGGVAGFDERLSGEIARQFGFRPAVMLRTREELERVLRENPFLAAAQDLEDLHIAFLGHEVAPELLERIQRTDFGPDRFVVADRHIYLFLPNGVSGSHLKPGNFYSKIGVHTVRNLRTASKLFELMSSC